MRSIEASTDISATPERVWDVTRLPGLGPRSSLAARKRTGRKPPN
jgi:hypothetical protein